MNKPDINLDQMRHLFETYSKYYINKQNDKEPNTEELFQMLSKCKNFYEFEKLIKKNYLLKECVLFKQSTIFEYYSDYHHHDYHEIIYMIKGDAMLFIDDKHYILKENDMAIIPKNSLHMLTILNKQGENLRYIINISDKYVKQFNTKNTNLLAFLELIIKKDSHIISFKDEQRVKIERLYEKMYKHSMDSRYGCDIKFNIDAIEILLLINSIFKNTADEELISNHISNEYVTMIVDYIKDNISKKIHLNDIANHISLSVSRTSHIFKEITGISITQYLIKKRLLLAKEMLANGESINNIIDKCGFPDKPSFFKFFKKEYNLTPKEYLSLN